MTGPRPRPGVLRWLYYAYGGGLGTKYAQWVLHDLTCRTWVLRHASRTVVQALPSLFFLLLPGPLWVRAYLPPFVVIGALLISLPWSEELREYRLYKHGFIPELVLRRGDPDDER